MSGVFPQFAESSVERRATVLLYILVGKGRTENRAFFEVRFRSQCGLNEGVNRGRPSLRSSRAANASDMTMRSVCSLDSVV